MSVVPAWKRLGLKLKQPSPDGSPVSGVTKDITSSFSPASAPQIASRSGDQQHWATYYDQGSTPHGFNRFKRKNPSSQSHPAENKRQWRDDHSNFISLRKSVSFSQDIRVVAPKKPKKKRKRKKEEEKEGPKRQTIAQPFDSAPLVKYLRIWATARDSWKFNKNLQTLLIKHLYKSDIIPSSEMNTFYEYISDVKGGSRSRLKEQAEQVRDQDANDGPMGFPEGTKAPEDKQKDYEVILTELMTKATEIKKEAANCAGGRNMGKRIFDEVEFTLRPLDSAVQQRVIKRMRAESVIEQLQSSGDVETACVTTPIPISTTTTRANVLLAHGDVNVAIDKTKQKLKTKRRKKLRTADSSSSDSDSDSNSSDSDSDPDSDPNSMEASSTGAKELGDGQRSSSESSDSDSDEDIVTTDGVGVEGYSSSNSSSSEDTSDSKEDAASDAASDAAADESEDSGSERDSETSDSHDDDDSEE